MKTRARLQTSKYFTGTDKRADNKQLLDEVEHDIVNYQNLVSVLSAMPMNYQNLVSVLSAEAED